MLPCVCSVIDHGRCQHVVRTDTLGYRLVCHLILFLLYFGVIYDQPNWSITEQTHLNMESTRLSDEKIVFQ